jgi:two-component system OmpR family response regulator
VSENKTILVVDDDEDFRIQLEMQLKAAGYTVRMADGETAAHAILAEYKPDLAVVDLMMEETDGGFTLCHHIKRDYPGMPVIMVTAVASETRFEFDATTPDERSWVRADAVLNKPVRFEQLQAEIQRLLGD